VTELDTEDGEVLEEEEGNEKEGNEEEEMRKMRRFQMMTWSTV
jgi:hypothetical protein